MDKPSFTNFRLFYEASLSLVRDYIRTNNYRVKGIDNLEDVKNILETGLRPGVHMSNWQGQGIGSGAYLLVYPGHKFQGTEVTYRPGDFTGASVKRKPLLIVFDVDEIMDRQPIEELERRYIAAHNEMEAYVMSFYPGVMTGKHESGAAQYDWKKFFDAGGGNDRKFKLIERKVENTSRDYFDALENENYQPKTSVDYFNELKALAAQHHIPVKKMRFDDSVDDFVFTR